MSKKPAFIPTQIAASLVAPYSLHDVLTSLKDNGFVRHFSIGANVTRIETRNEKKFEIACLMAEINEIPSHFQSKKKPIP